MEPFYLLPEIWSVPNLFHYINELFLANLLLYNLCMVSRKLCLESVNNKRIVCANIWRDYCDLEMLIGIMTF